MDNILSEKIKLNNVLHSFILFTLSFCNCQELEITFGVFRRVINTDKILVSWCSSHHIGLYHMR